MNIRWLVLFAAIAEEGSFTRAATRLNIAQPWLSAQLRKLEEEFGIKLVERLSAGIELTPDGRALLPYAQQVAEASRKFRDRARTMGASESLVVRIGSDLPMIDIALLRKLNDDFTQRYANFSLRGTLGATNDILDQLKHGQLDIVAALSPLPDDDEYEQIRLGSLHPYLLVPRNAALAKTGLAGADLSGQQIAMLPPALHPGLHDLLSTPLLAAGATIRPVPEVDKRAMEHFARAHRAIVLMIEGDATDYAKDRDLAALPLPDVVVENILMRLRGRDLGRAAERYWTMVAGSVKEAAALAH